ncbi:MAG: cytidylate kinase-like family protein [Clostridiales bacterium]|nr:cytidylate kinase-like family protein [Clostridiales bacterium]
MYSKRKTVKNSQQRTASRRAYYRNITGKNWGDMHNYDLVIDSSVGVEKSVETIMNMLKDTANDK